MSTSVKRNPDWTREELMLALDLYLKADSTAPELFEAAVQEVSQHLCSLNIHPLTKRNEKFRAPEGVKRRLRYFKRIESGEDIGGRETYISVWEEFHEQPEKLRAEVENILSKVNVDRDWNLQPGDKIKRTELHRKFGGSGQSGIAPSRKSNVVLVFSDPKSGEQHGYFDSWKADGCFHYTGDGQRGDQEFVRGNRAIYRAAAEGKTIRLFYGAGGTVEYVDRVELDQEVPYYEASWISCWTMSRSIQSVWRHSALAQVDT